MSTSAQQGGTLAPLPTICALHACSHLSTSGWWGGHPVNNYPVWTRFGTPSGLCTLSFRLLPFCSSVLNYPAVCPAWSASLSVFSFIDLQRVVGRLPFNTYPVGSCFGILGYLPSVSDDQTCRLVDVLVGGGLYASA